MLRLNTARSLIRSIPRAPAASSSYSTSPIKFPTARTLQQLNSKRPRAPLSLRRPTTTSLLYATKSSEPPFTAIDRDAERKHAEEKLVPHPEEISTQSSVRRAFEGAGKSKASKEGSEDEMLSGIKSDLGTIKETFGLTEVPKEPLYLGIAGVLPYAVTSLSTVFLAYDINHAHATGQGLLLSPETAHYLLDTIIPLQIGYGAVIISFLGAIHWGLEYAGYGGVHSYRRYMYGVIAPAVAWPTIFMPVEYALLAQFTALIFQYFADARATVKGWFPPWYATYRFVLTFLAGASIVLSLVGRGQIVKADIKVQHRVGMADHDHDAKYEALERDERERRQRESETEAEEKESKDESENDEESDDKKDSKSDKEGTDDKKEKK